MATQDVLDFISRQRTAGKGVKIDFSSLPPDVDARQVVGAMTDGLPPEHANAINALAMGGKGAAVDYGRIQGAQPQGPAPGQGGIYQDYPIRRKLSQYVIRPGLEMGGQAVGGAAGAALAAAPAAASGPAAPAVEFAGAKLGAGVGGTGGDILADKIDKWMGLYHPETMSPEAMKRMRLTQLASNTAGSVLGSAAGSVAKDIAAPYQGEIDQAVQGSAQKLDVPVPAGGLLKAETPGRMEALFSKLPFASDVMREYYQGSRDKMVGILNGLFKSGESPSPETVDRLGMQVAQNLGEKVDDLAKSGVTPQLDPGDVGSSVRTDVMTGLKNMAKKAGGVFDALKKSDTGTPIPTPLAAKQAQSLIDEGINAPAISNAASILSQGGGLPSLSQSVGPAERAALEKAVAAQGGATGGATLSNLIDLRSMLSAAADSHLVEGGRGMASDRIGGAYNSLIGALDKDIQASPEIAQKYAQARAGWQQYASFRDNSAIRRVLGAEQPEAIVDNLIHPESQSNLAKAMTLMGPESQNQLRASFITRAINGARDADGVFSPSKLNSFLGKFDDKSLMLAAGEDGADGLKRIANLGHGSFADQSFSDPNFRNFVTMLGKRDGANLSGLLLQPNNAANINRARALIGEKSFADAHDSALFDLVTNNQGNIDFGGLGKRLKASGDDTLQALFGPETTATLHDLENVGRGLGRAEKVFSNPSGTAQVFGLMAILFRALNNPLNALKFVGTLTGVAKAYTSPMVTKWLTEGVAPGVTSDAANLITRYPVSVIGNSLANPYKKRGKK